jgi:hypothetical protein
MSIFSAVLIRNSYVRDAHDRSVVTFSLNAEAATKLRYKNQLTVTRQREAVTMKPFTP